VVTKRQLVISVAEQLGITQNEVSDVVQTTLETITEALATGDRLEIRNFGVFEVKVRDARLGRNPRTGESVPIAEKRIPIFKPGKALKEWVEMADPTAKAPSIADPVSDERDQEDAPAHRPYRESF
jgi:integration host factor subunit beta